MSFSSEEDSGKLWIEGDFVHYESKTYASWQLHLDEIRIIGEMTNQNGPFVDDYFICFAKDSSGWLEASFYADGRESSLNALGAFLGAKIELHLATSADFASRITWPEHLKDQPMFKFIDKVPRGLWQRLADLISHQNLQTLSDVALGELSDQAKEQYQRPFDDQAGDDV